ncbi:Os07g0227750 [Oryza sativa Japonica Group]|uniref:Os07g0227750 protein n=1 Tax=Oryza sativa subsp. japonica TaxID=39947 RepID=A0A0P0X447_ORYSJ|nr:hypothetical protein EE612_038000 [Oryza sativa]BAT00691.1 Os07g0227750 [Oryza sativa Japonica Group]
MAEIPKYMMYGITRTHGAYQTLSAVTKVSSGSGTRDLIESRSVSGTPYNLSIVRTRFVLQWRYTKGALACLSNPIASMYL